MILINYGLQIIVSTGDITKFKWNAKWLINIDKYSVPKQKNRNIGKKY